MPFLSQLLLSLILKTPEELKNGLINLFFTSNAFFRLLFAVFPSILVRE
jgi:hypothetical protein